ncbi:T9SS type A sorting domain-containing protein [bacterium]|nr:T9SS type A sorting domain-containing protein [bacterium]
MNKVKNFLRKKVPENLKVIAFVFFTTFFVHFSLLALTVDKISIPIKSQQDITIVQAETERDLTIRGELLAKSIVQYKTEITESIAASTLNLKFKKDLKKHINPAKLINTFLKQIDQICATSNKIIALKPMRFQLSQQLPRSEAGAITGTITVDGEPPDTAFPVLAFDSHGYFAGEAEVDLFTGEYQLSNLREDSYYVITWSNIFVDEIYPDQIAAMGSLEAWRNAQTVAVSAGITTADINFDLQKGTVISGVITTADSSDITDVTLELTTASSPNVLLSKNVPVVEKKYQVTVPGNGEYKLSVHAYRYIQAWYQNATDSDNATPITISAGNDTLHNINFSLSPQLNPPQFGTISGYVRDPVGGSDFGVMPVFAFSADDMSFAGYGISMGFFGGSILEFYLEPGEYYLYASDPTGGLMGTNTAGHSYLGMFYPETPLVDEAQTVTVMPGEQTVLDSGLVLQYGGIITGRVTDPMGEGLDSLQVIAFRKEGQDDENNPDFTQLQMAFDVTDSTGNYTLTGLAGGEYLVRTLTSSLLDTLNEMIGLYLFPTAIYADRFVDEYYGDVHNIFDFEKAATVPVTVPQTTSGIDIQLDPVGFIGGSVTSAEDGSPINDIILLALDPVSGFPEFTLGAIDSSGNYVLGPLLAGSYKIMAISGFLASQHHLTEFFDGARNFESAICVDVLAEQTTDNIHITLDRGAVIQGFLDIDPGDQHYQAGADTSHGAPIIVYHAESGKTAGYDFVQFNGGYRVNRLLPGTYKVSAMPTVNPLASTYAGGGITFDDPLNAIIEVGYGEVADINIEPGRASGTISGRVIDENTRLPLSMIMVAAYDLTGHAVGAALTDTDFLTGNAISANGSYRIFGLRSGAYYLKTFALTDFLPILQSFMGLLDLDLMSIIANPGVFLELNPEAYADKWYPDIPEALSVDVIDLLMGFTSYGIPSEQDNSLFPVYLPIPFFSQPPSGATLVHVIDESETTDVNFELTLVNLLDLLNTAVKELPSENTVPHEFTLSQNYPNPFNPCTHFTYSVPERSFVDLAVYDMLGRKVRTLLHEVVQRGSYIESWDGRDRANAVMPSGIYIIRIKSQNHVHGIRVTLIR